MVKQDFTEEPDEDGMRDQDGMDDAMRAEIEKSSGVSD
jgi:hypothetical protein